MCVPKGLTRVINTGNTPRRITIAGISRKTETISSVVIVYTRRVRVRKHIESLCGGEFFPLARRSRFRGIFPDRLPGTPRKIERSERLCLQSIASHRSQNKSFRLRRRSCRPRDRGDKFVVSNRRTYLFAFKRQISQFAPPCPSGSNLFRRFAFLSLYTLPPSFPAGRCWFRPPNGPSFAPAICTKTVRSFLVRIHLVNLKIALNVFTHEAIDLLLFG